MQAGGVCFRKHTFSRGKVSWTFPDQKATFTDQKATIPDQILSYVPFILIDICVARFHEYGSWTDILKKNWGTVIVSKGVLVSQRRFLLETTKISAFSIKGKHLAHPEVVGFYIPSSLCIPLPMNCLPCMNPTLTKFGK